MKLYLKMAFDGLESYSMGQLEGIDDRLIIPIE